MRWRAAARGAAKSRARNGSRAIAAANISGAEHLEAIYEVDQSPIGKTSRSTPATYIKVFDEIREALRAAAGLARARLHREPLFLQHRRRPLRNLQRPGRDQAGDEFPAEQLRAVRRLRRATLQRRRRSRCSTTSNSIGDVMEMTIEQAAEFFAAQPEDRAPARAARATPASATSSSASRARPERRRSAAAQARDETDARSQPRDERAPAQNARRRNRRSICSRSRPSACTWPTWNCCSTSSTAWSMTGTP